MLTIAREAGYEEALLGLSFSKLQPIADMQDVALRLHDKDGGHNKFLEMMCVWMIVTAPRYWWQQFDAYRIGVTKQSESTMHTLMDRPLTQDDFSHPIPNLDELNQLIRERDFHRLKALLPEGFKQRRVVCTNYKTLRNIVSQRKSHKLEEWRIFCEELLDQLRHPELI